MPTDALKSILGSQVRALRLSRRLTQEQIAEQLGVTPRYFAGIERGERNLTLDSVDALALRLGVPAQSLFDDDGQSHAAAPRGVDFAHGGSARVSPDGAFSAHGGDSAASVQPDTRGRAGRSRPGQNRADRSGQR